jgi:large subunit ribosomal protein L13
MQKNNIAEMKTIDATNKKLGRVASEAASILRGKNLVTFTPHVFNDVKVEVINASKINADDTKKRTKIYKRYSGYPGGQRELSLEKMEAKKGMKEAVKIAVRGMLPPNKLRAKMMRNLTITD